MPLDEEVEIIAYLHELLEKNFSPEMRVFESDDPNDSPIIMLNYNGNVYCIAVEEYPLREEKEED